WNDILVAQLAKFPTRNADCFVHTPEPAKSVNRYPSRLVTCTPDDWWSGSSRNPTSSSTLSVPPFTVLNIGSFRNPYVAETTVSVSARSFQIWSTAAVTFRSVTPTPTAFRIVSGAPP